MKKKPSTAEEAEQKQKQERDEALSQLRVLGGERPTKKPDEPRGDN